MKFKLNGYTVVQSPRTHKWGIVFEIPEDQVEKFKKLSSEVVNIEIKKQNDNRSLSANSYLWVLLGKLSNALTIPKGDLYIKMIKRYGVFTSFAIQAEAVKELFKHWDSANTSVEHVESLCEVTSGFVSKGVKWVEVTCHFGISDYSKEEFSKVLNGVISECELMGVETMTPNEIERLMQNYQGG